MLPQFKESASHRKEVQKEYEAIAEAEILKKKRREHLKGKYAELLKDYHCDTMMQQSNFPYKGMAILKLLARKEEEFSEKKQNYQSISL